MLFLLIVVWLHVVFFLIDGCAVTRRFLLIVAWLHVVFVDWCVLRRCFLIDDCAVTRRFFH